MPETETDGTTFTDSFSKEIYEQTYRFGNEDINGTQQRVAKFLASQEDPKVREQCERDFLWALQNFKFVPGGRITSNAGTELKGTSLINCFVSGAQGEDQDSMEGILAELRRQALILKSEGGYGVCANFMRPRGAFIHGIGNSSPGSVKMLEMWDTQSAVITAGSGKKNKEKNSKQKIRKGAQMVTMSCWHPDVLEFITAKQTPGRLTKFNMSVLITDAFMKAVETNGPWNLEYPDFSAKSEEYCKHWDGNLDRWKNELKLPTQVYHSFEDANELWDTIMKSTYNRNEPGVLFVDTMNRMNNLYYTEHINATNPCGEQILPIGGVCLLGSINLTQFFNGSKDSGKIWDYSLLAKLIPIAVRLMDNVNDLTYVPLPEQRDNLKNKRRIGLGILGYASSLMMAKVRYGSERALKETEELMSFIANTAYQASAKLAKEKGSFSLFDSDKYLAGNFVKVLSNETRKSIKENGLRNSHLLSIQPTGNSSVYANNVSGGLEPIFLTEYTRTSIQPFAPEGLHLPKNVDWKANTADLPHAQNWEWVYEGDESLLRTEFNGFVWKMDRSRGLLRETTVRDYSVRYLNELGEWDPTADYAATTLNLGIDDHVKTMKIFARYVDSALSKTCNLPQEFSYSDFKNVYIDAYKAGVKGFTTYRAGTMASVLSSTTKPDKIQKAKAPPRPEVLDCDINVITAGGERYVVLIGLLDSQPFEVFAFLEKDIKFNEKLTFGKLRKVKNETEESIYVLETDFFVISDIQAHFDHPEEQSLTRMISTALKHGTDISEIYRQLQKAHGSITSFSKAIARTLSSYVTEWKDSLCPECKDPNGITFQEGCLKCKNCGYSKCL